MEKEFEKLLNKLFGNEKVLIRGEIRYSSVRIHATCGSNPEAIKEIKEDYGIEEKEIDKLAEKYLKPAFNDLSNELAKMIQKNSEKEHGLNCKVLTIEVKRDSEDKE